jgi:transposase
MGNASDSAMHQHRHDVGEYRRIEVITGISRRRRWMAEEKASLVAESLQPDVNVSALARRHGVNRGLLQTWRRTALREMANHGAAFIPLRVEDAAPLGHSGTPAAEVTVRADGKTQPGVIELEGSGVRVRFSGSVDVGALRLVLGHLGRRA